MDNFLSELLKPFIIFMLLTFLGYLKAVLRNSPLANINEFIKYYKSLSKPAIWTFICMFLLIFIFGLLANGDFIKVTQKAIIAGLYASTTVYIFMVWGANLIKQ